MVILNILGAKCIAAEPGHPARFSVIIFGEKDGSLAEKEVFFLASNVKEKSFEAGKTYSLSGQFEASLKTTETGEFISLFLFTRDCEECFPRKSGKMLITASALKTWGEFATTAKTNWARISLKNISGKIFVKDVPNIKPDSSVLVNGGELDFYISKNNGKSYLNCSIRTNSIQYGFGPPAGKNNKSAAPTKDVPHEENVPAEYIPAESSLEDFSSETGPEEGFEQQDPKFFF